MHDADTERPLPVVEVVAGVMVDGDRVLLARRSDHGRWEFPGGKIVPGETPAEALHRELHEEFGIDAAAGIHLGTTDYTTPERTLRLLFVRVDRYSGVLELRDHSHADWVPLPDLPAYDLMPADVAFARHLARAGCITPMG
jgi:mutator protein MutT